MSEAVSTHAEVVQHGDSAGRDAAARPRSLREGLLTLAEAEGETALLDLPADRPRPPSPSHRGGSRAFRLAPDLLGEVRALAAGSGATLFVTLLAAFQALLGRYTGRDDLLVGAPAAGRSRRGLDGLVGHFVNLLTLRADLAGDPPFSEVLARTRRNVAGAVEHQDFPFPLLVERLQPARDPARPPLVQAALALEEAPRLAREGVGPFLLGSEGAVLRLGELNLEAMALPRRAAQLDLVLMAVEAEGGLAARLDYSADLFDAATAERMAGHFTALLAGAAADPGRPLSELPLLSAPERAQVRWEWNDTAVASAAWTASGASGRLEELFRERAARDPERLAVDDGSRRWTYRKLAGRASRLAARLRELGVGPEVPVGLHLDRSAPLVAAIVATLEAGGICLPLDPGHPRERLELFLRESGARVLLTGATPGEEPHGRQVHTLRTEDLEDLEASAASLDALAGSRELPMPPEGLAYLIYTSGSTGEPKAVGCHHLGAVNLLADYAARYPFGHEDRCSWWTSPGFDASILEIFPGLLAGATALPASRRLALAPRGITGGDPSPAPPVAVGADSPAYVAFTSGSTGVPKGILGRHGSLSHFLPWMAEFYGLGAEDRFSLLSALAHDPLQRDLFTPLCLGARLCVPDPAEMLMPGRLAAWLRREGVTVANLTPAMAQVLTEPVPGQILGPDPDGPALPSLRYVFLVGDALTRWIVARLRPLAPTARWTAAPCCAGKAVRRPRRPTGNRPPTASGGSPSWSPRCWAPGAWGSTTTSSSSGATPCCSSSSTAGSSGPWNTRFS